MRTVIIGDAPLLTAFKSHLPQRAWDIPPQGRNDPAGFLTTHPPKNGEHWVVLTDEAADWLRVSKTGWRVVWFGSGTPPYGTQPMPTPWQDMTVAALAQRLWGVRVNDARNCGAVASGMTGKAGVLLSVTSATGGVGKTTTARRLAERAAEQGLRTLLVDGNIRQSSQRGFFDPARTMDVPTIADWRPNSRMSPRAGVTHGNVFGVPYDIAFAPPKGLDVTWEHYLRFLRVARRPDMWQLVILDLDRISADDLTDPHNVAGGLLLPSITAGDPCLLLVKAGQQTQSDAVNLLEQLRMMHTPKQLIGIKDVLGVGIDQYEPTPYEDYGTFLGIDHMSRQASQLLNTGRFGWPDPQLDATRERVLAWAMPDEGFNPAQYETGGKTKKRRWFA